MKVNETFQGEGSDLVNVEDIQNKQMKKTRTTTAIHATATTITTTTTHATTTTTTTTRPLFYRLSHLAIGKRFSTLAHFERMNVGQGEAQVERELFASMTAGEQGEYQGRERERERETQGQQREVGVTQVQYHVGGGVVRIVGQTEAGFWL